MSIARATARKQEEDGEEQVENGEEEFSPNMTFS